MTDPDRLAALAEAGVSIWLDDLSRDLLASGDLARLSRDEHVVGVTTNPTIFAPLWPTATLTKIRFSKSCSPLRAGGHSPLRERDPSARSGPPPA